METLEHAVEALRRSDRPLTSRKILELIPPPSRVDAASLEGLLRADNRIVEWPLRSGAAQYWTEKPEHAAERGLLRVLADSPLGPGALEAKLASCLRGYPGKDRPKLIRECLATLVEAGRLYRYPRVGRRGVKYCAKPAAAADYAVGLAKELAALAGKLAPAGVTREALLAALAGGERGRDLARDILARVGAVRGAMGIPELRGDLAPAPADKTRFDHAVLSLWRERRVYLDRHLGASGLSEEDRNRLVTDGAGNYYVMISLRDADAEPVS